MAPGSYSICIVIMERKVSFSAVFIRSFLYLQVTITYIKDCMSNGWFKQYFIPSNYTNTLQAQHIMKTILTTSYNSFSSLNARGTT